MPLEYDPDGDFGCSTAILNLVIFKVNHFDV